VSLASSSFRLSARLSIQWISVGTGNRDKIFLATKFGITPDFTIRGDPEFVKSECAKSLKKLRTDHIDLYYQHRSDANTPIELTVGAMVELVKYVVGANIVPLYITNYELPPCQGRKG
jgi:aryl-alcohol dehydrogenase-like predicted oxidoreductase